MNLPEVNSGLLFKIMKKLGGFYLIFAVALAQMASNIVSIPIAYITQVNAELTPDHVAQINQMTLALTVLGNIIIWATTFIRNRAAFKRLQQWAKGQTLVSGSQDEVRAWKQITTAAWNYAFVGSVTAVGIIIIPLQIFQMNAFAMTENQVIYTLFGGMLTIMSIITLDVMILERLLTPARVALTPREFNDQLIGAAGFRLLAKSLVFILAVIGIGILLVAPIGYHQTYTALYEEIGSLEVLENLQVQSILASVFSVILGTIISYLLSTSISKPVGQMIETFQKVESGDLKQRIPVTATDEIAELTVYFNRMVARLEEFQGSLERQVQERTAQLTATLEVGRVASQILDQDELITTVVNLIVDKFNFYFASIYLVDSNNRWLEFKAGTGEAGRLLRESKYRLEINEKSMVGAAVKTKTARLAMNVAEEKSYLVNPLLPYTRSEMTLPLSSGDRILGVLDVQSTDIGSFSESDIETLQGMANQLAIALENARLFQETQDTLDEVRTVHRQYLSSAWGRAAESDRIEFTSGDDRLSSGVIAELDVPITLRDQVIGQIKLEGEDDWNNEERALIEAVATQAALALENARLLEESQQLAVRERLISEIGAKIWASTTVDSILQTAVREIGRVMNATEAAIEIELEHPEEESA
jgi:GAF domain-containing protein/HAMP domain-containing protein